MDRLTDLVKRQMKNNAGITDNQTLESFSLEYCEIIDKSDDEFVIGRKKRCCEGLKQIGIDYDSRIKTVYEAYSETICYIDLKRLCNISNVYECEKKTPDFKISYDSTDIYIEMKSLSFADGNSNYKKSQDSAFWANVSREEQLKQGKGIIWTEREVLPMAKNGIIPSFRDLLKILHDKIEQNIKKEQLIKGETILLIDLNQLGVSYRASENVAIERSYNGIGYSSGMLWTLAFSKEHDRLFITPEFEGKPNIEKEPIGFNGILIDYPELRGLMFAVGKDPSNRAFVGFYRYEEQDSLSVKFIHEICSFYNDNYNSYCFDVNKEFIPVRKIQSYIKEQKISIQD